MAPDTQLEKAADRLKMASWHIDVERLERSTTD